MDAAQESHKVGLSLLCLFKYLAVACLFFLLFTSKLNAATDNQTSGGIVYPQITAENLTIEKNLKSQTQFPIRFVLNNVENRGAFDIGYRLRLTNSKDEIFFQQDIEKLYAFSPFEKKQIEKTFPVTNIPTGDYVLSVTAISPDGVDLGSVEETVSIDGHDFKPVTVKNISVSSGDQIGSSAGGVVVNAGDTVKAEVSVVTDRQIKARVRYSTYENGNFAVPGKDYGDELNLKKGENKFGISVKSGSGSNSSVSFLLFDQNESQISPLGVYSWGVWGTTSYLKYLTVDKQQAKAGEVVDVEVVINPIISPEPHGEVNVKVFVDGSTGEGVINLAETASAVVNVKLKSDINYPVVRLEAEENGVSVLSYRTNKATSLEKNIVRVVGNYKSVFYFVLAAVVVALLVVVGYYFKPNRTVKLAVIVLFAFSFLAVVKTNAFASFSSSTSYTTVPSISGPCSPASSYFYVQNFFLYQNGSLTAAPQNTLFRPGDTIRFNGRMNSGSGSCTYYGTGSHDLGIGATDVGGGSGRSWDQTVTLDDTFDSIAYKNTYAEAEVRSEIRSLSTAGRIESRRSMTIKFGPRAIEAPTLGVSVPACSDTNYNATFNFTGRALAENYDVEWSTDWTFATGVTIETIAGGGGAQSFTTTTNPFENVKTYYWRVRAYNSIAGSEIVTNAPAPFGPLTTCTPPPQPSITACSISPTTVNVGQNVNISVTIKNNRSTAISTQGPDSGFTYTEAQNFNTAGFPRIAGKFRVMAGNASNLWKWRWGFGPPTSTTLASGASTTVTGSITMGTVGTKALDIGLIEELVAAVETGKCPTTVIVNPAPVEYDLSLISLTNTDSKTNFDIGEIANMRAVVRNNASVPSPATTIYLFPDDSWTRPNCPTSGITIPPKDSAGADMNFAVPSIAAAGGPDETIDFNFTVSSTPNPSITAYAYVVPSCSFSPAPGTDPDPGNNFRSFTYIVSADRFFETVGGDVGAVGNISASVDSTALSTPIYQSDYVIAASAVGSKVKSKEGWTLSNYAKSLVKSGGVYDFFDSRYPDKGTSSCSVSGASGVRYCDDDLTYSSVDTIPPGTTLFFVDKNLNIVDDLILPSGRVIVFVVKGNIIVDLDVVRIDGVYIAKKGFSDSDVGASASGVSPTGALVLNGALYVDADGGSLELKRYFSGPYNTTQPSDRFVYQLGYLLQLSDFFNFKSLIWNEIAP